MNEQIGAKLHISVKFVVVIDKIVDKNVALNDRNLEIALRNYSVAVVDLRLNFHNNWDNWLNLLLLLSPTY